ncbi:MAG: hypothetical protein J7M27_12775 [Candidatus Latescibacteria bacterium]|nr:hypothetical protein [Candidatus Latescibacterota bacterium]
MEALKARALSNTELQLMSPIPLKVGRRFYIEISEVSSAEDSEAFNMEETRLICGNPEFVADILKAKEDMAKGRVYKWEDALDEQDI